MHALIATGVNAGGHREIVGLDVTTTEDGASGWCSSAAFAARGLPGVHLATSDAHPGLIDAIASVLPGATWQGCRAHYAWPPGPQVRPVGFHPRAHHR